MGNKLSARREKRRLRRMDLYKTIMDDRLTPKEETPHNERLVGYEEDELTSEESSWITVEEEKCYDPEDTTLTFVEGDDVLDFLYEDFKSLRAKMSCGHAVTPMSLTNWCNRLLDEGRCKFVCGQTGCDVEWPFEEVRKMALLTPEEIEYFEKILFSNAAKDYLDVKACPGCKSHVVRSNLHNVCVECTVCTTKRGRIYRFCWHCLKRWTGPARSDHCENDECQSPLKILKSCPDITFEDVEGVTGCPSIRACPTCGLLVEHNKTQCKTMICLRCKVKFCFVCLKLSEECRSYYELCSSGVAPRQKSIPVRQRTSVNVKL
ncbi:probable E3 ubiquitin-protein ligase RNF144A-A [Sebastes umbrosus]|uniref:probable E3 ubiquitin-protein ligase RNF144A-A n=1 Tax=Sebastes umbrosus TaxID=72105 RepID=UPI0018A09291|nr:probable E3 ubiquitin-protein ligase RNF144A-A [Sebastes umbrosus]